MSTVKLPYQGDFSRNKLIFFFSILSMFACCFHFLPSMLSLLSCFAMVSLFFPFVFLGVFLLFVCFFKLFFVLFFFFPSFFKLGLGGGEAGGWVCALFPGFWARACFAMFFLCFFKLIFWGFLLCFAFFQVVFFVIFRFFAVFSSGFPAEGERGGEFVRFFLVFGPGPVLLCFSFVFSS